MAAHMHKLCPDRSYAILERRADLGGTWDLFRYPGIRSDSDMHTLGFVFEPWKHEKSIADGPSILDYLNRIVDERGIRPNIRFDTRVVSANWDSAAALWRIVTETADGRRGETTARFVYLGSGYYDYDDPYDAGFAGRETFKGELIHPQFWPKDFDYSGKRVLVIGSGATAVTIVPAMAEKAAKVTMLQRTPTWYGIRPAKDAFANTLRKFLPEKVAYAITRFKNIRLQNLVFKRARTQPEKVRDFLTERLKDALGDKYDAATFTPPYNPWEQRLCLVPDADMFEAIKADRAEIVTGHIDRFDQTGVLLKDGRHLDADVIVTATGLKLAVAGKIAFSIDGAPIDFSQHFFYKGCMFSNVPNLALVFGYLNASWTLRADIDSDYVCRLLNHMKRTGTEVATPCLAADHGLVEDDIFEFFSSGYLQRARGSQPKNATEQPWRLNQDYVKDKPWLKASPIDDGVMRFGHARSLATNEPALEAAE
ncbi:MAG: NAD(P)/FAD-dependent oxidoreductase [Sphingomonadales bacterium]|nr:NAD(P)/FAD-dependent oxidoreductase [Sphingomonadales bacterium]MDE2568849.1 NAD(P)/FAD-dependent oxidoreductase [Sphingomonadales bacterium]